MNYNTANHKALTNDGLTVANMIVQALRLKGIEAKVGKTYLDYGQNLTWDTILVTCANGSSYQALNPRQFEEMNNGTFDYAEINDIIDDAQRLAQ